MANSGRNEEPMMKELRELIKQNLEIIFGALEHEDYRKSSTTFKNKYIIAISALQDTLNKLQNGSIELKELIDKLNHACKAYQIIFMRTKNQTDGSPEVKALTTMKDNISKIEDGFEIDKIRITSRDIDEIYYKSIDKKYAQEEQVKGNPEETIEVMQKLIMENKLEYDDLPARISKDYQQEQLEIILKYIIEKYTGDEDKKITPKSLPNTYMLPLYMELRFAIEKAINLKKKVESKKPDQFKTEEEQTKEKSEDKTSVNRDIKRIAKQALLKHLKRKEKWKSLIENYLGSGKINSTYSSQDQKMETFIKVLSRIDEFQKAIQEKPNTDITAVYEEKLKYAIQDAITAAVSDHNKRNTQRFGIFAKIEFTKSDVVRGLNALQAAIEREINYQDPEVKSKIKSSKH